MEDNQYPEKRCTRCKQTKPRDEFSPAKLGRDGRAAECKACNNQRRHKNRPLERSEAKRLGLSHYFTGRPCVNGHIARRYTSGGCVECIKEAAKQNPEDPEKRKQRKKRWDEENAGHRRAYYEQTREHQLEYGRQYRLQDIEKERKRKRKYRELNRDLYRASATIRRARASRPNWADQKAIREVYLACPPDKVVDHIVPLYGLTVEGYKIRGLHVPWNLQYLAPKENFKKNNRMRTADQAIAESATLSGEKRLRRPRS